MKRCMWVWNLFQHNLEEFKLFCKKKNVDKLFLNYIVYEEFIDELKDEFEVIPLIGDSKNELTEEDIMTICEKYDRVHLDIELNTNVLNFFNFYKYYKIYCNFMKTIITNLKNKRKIVEVDVHPWLPFCKYKKAISDADEWHLMSYSSSFIGTLIQTIFFMKKKFSIGFETNPDLVCKSKDVSKRMEQFSFMKRFKNFLGFSIHCWGFWK